MDRASSCSSTGKQLNLGSVRPEKSSAQRASAFILKCIAVCWLLLLCFVFSNLKMAASEVLVWCWGDGVPGSYFSSEDSCSSRGLASFSGVFTLSVLTMQVGRWRFSITMSCWRSWRSSSIWAFSSEFTISRRSDSWMETCNSVKTLKAVPPA